MTMTINEEILINITPQETRVAIVENGALQEVSIERQRSRGIVGNIYKGKVNRVLPGMEAAFVDINHFLRKGHLQQLASILDDNAASPHDKFVAFERGICTAFHRCIIAGLSVGIRKPSQTSARYVEADVTDVLLRSLPFCVRSVTAGIKIITPFFAWKYDG